MLAEMSPEERARMLAEMSPEERARLLAEISLVDREAHLNSLGPEEQAVLKLKQIELTNRIRIRTSMSLETYTTTLRAIAEMLPIMNEVEQAARLSKLNPEERKVLSPLNTASKYQMAQLELDATDVLRLHDLLRMRAASELVD